MSVDSPLACVGDWVSSPGCWQPLEVLRLTDCGEPVVSDPLHEGREVILQDYQVVARYDDPSLFVAADI